MGLNDIGAKLPPGFRFYPSDEELVCHYLYKKIANEDVQKGTLVEIDLHTCEPWQLPEVAKLNSSEWYFFSFRDRKYTTGYRTNRATKSGYWKATGKDRTVTDSKSGAIVGMRKTLVFYKNRAPNGIKSGWIMHEFRLENPHIPPKEDWVLCRVFHKAKGGNKNEFSPQNTAIDNTLTKMDTPPVTTTDGQPPPCGCHHHITTNNNHQSLMLHYQDQNLLDSLPQKYDFKHHDFVQMSPNNTPKEFTDQVIVNSNNKCENQESSLFLDFGLEYSIPSPLQNLGFVDEHNGDDGIVFF